MDPKKNTIAPLYLLGAFDRFNYGDLIFPIVVKNELFKYGFPESVDVHALIETDLSHFGALPTKSIRTLYNNARLNCGGTIIFAGGGTVGVDWKYMYSNLVGNFGNSTLYYASRVFGSKIINWYCRSVLGGKSLFPWVAEPLDFPGIINVAYNAIGGSELNSLSTETKIKIFDRLSKATYLSVRDAETKKVFLPLIDRITVELAPDSAVIMSEQFPISWLKGQITNSLNELVTGAPYMCFQCNLTYATRHEDEIVKVIEQVYRNQGLRTLLLPIGRYVGLDDQVGLRNICKRVKTPIALISDEATIWEIMYVIACSNLFLGTSLHGNITSQSFAIPHLGLSDRPCKLDYYLDTWDLPEQSRCATLASLNEAIYKVLNLSEMALVLKRDELIGLVRQNFQKMFSACKLNNFIT